MNFSKLSILIMRHLSNKIAPKILIMEIFFEKKIFCFTPVNFSKFKRDSSKLNSLQYENLLEWLLLSINQFFSYRTNR